MVIHRLEKVRCLHIERAGQAEEGVQGHIPLASLYPGNIGRFPAGSAGEIFLSQTQRVPAIADGRPKELERCSLLHLLPASAIRCVVESAPEAACGRGVVHNERRGATPNAVAQHNA